MIAEGFIADTIRLVKQNAGASFERRLRMKIIELILCVLCGGTGVVLLFCAYTLFKKAV
jgi:hypothetical protein